MGLTCEREFEMTDIEQFAREIDNLMSDVVRLAATNDFDAAVRVIQQIRADNRYRTHEATFLNVLLGAEGYIFEMKGDYDRAVELYRKAAEASTQFPSAYLTNVDSAASLLATMGVLKEAASEIWSAFPVVNCLASPDWFVLYQKYDGYRKSADLSLPASATQMVRGFAQAIGITTSSDTSFDDSMKCIADALGKQ
jgi:TPR repeat protein